MGLRLLGGAGRAVEPHEHVDLGRALPRGLGPHLRFGAGVAAAEFDERHAVWNLTLDDGETLQATARRADGAIQRAVVFPSYGALAGVWVPRGASEVQVTARSPRPPRPALWRALGAALLLWQTMYSPRRRRP